MSDERPTWRGAAYHEGKFELRRAWTGQDVTITWGMRGDNAAVTSDDERLDLVYLGRRDGMLCWFRANDPLTCHKSARLAIDAVMAEHFGNPPRRHQERLPNE